METSVGSYERSVNAELIKLQECQLCNKKQRKVCLPCSHVLCSSCAKKITTNNSISCPWQCGMLSLPAGGCREVSTLNEFSDFLMSRNVRKCLRHLCESRYIQLLVFKWCSYPLNICLQVVISLHF